MIDWLAGWSVSWLAEQFVGIGWARARAGLIGRLLVSSFVCWLVGLLADGWLGGGRLEMRQVHSRHVPSVPGLWNALHVEQMESDQWNVLGSLWSEQGTKGT